MTPPRLDRDTTREWQTINALRAQGWHVLHSDPVLWSEEEVAAVEEALQQRLDAVVLLDLAEYERNSRGLVGLICVPCERVWAYDDRSKTAYREANDEVRLHFRDKHADIPQPFRGSLRV